MARKKIQLAEVNSLPTVVKGSHLTVTTHPDGKTELEWDDEALLNEVREAIKSAELANMKPAVRAKSKKSVAKTK
jgi:YD repeat-containing protein